MNRRVPWASSASVPPVGPSEAPHAPFGNEGWWPLSRSSSSCWSAGSSVLDSSAIATFGSTSPEPLFAAPAGSGNGWVSSPSAPTPSSPVGTESFTPSESSLWTRNP